MSSAVTALGSLTGSDVKAGTVAQPAANAIVGDAQQISTASGSGQSALAGFMKLGADISNFAQHGQISAAAVPALNGAVAAIGTALEQSAETTTTQTPAGPGQQSGPGPHHGRPGGGPPPGQAKKPGK